MFGNSPPGLVAVPTVDWMYTSCAVSLQALSHNLPKGSRWTWSAGNSKPIDAKRNAAVRQMLQERKLKWVCFLDSDMIFPEDTVERLRAVDADIACGLYLKKGPQSDYAALAAHAVHLPDEAPAERPTDHPEYQHRTLDLRKVGPELGVTDVDMAGTGCMLIHRRVFREVGAPWFQANRIHRVGFNEDYNFCLRAKRAGLTVKVDTELECRHVGMHGVGVAEARGHWRERVARQKRDRG